MWKVVWVRDLGHRAPLLRIVCFAWVPGSSVPLLLSLSPYSLYLFHSPPLSLPALAGPYAQNLRLISPSAGQSVVHIYLCATVWEIQRVCDTDIQRYREGKKKMKGAQRNPVSSSCHCSGVARSDSKISAKALYGKWLHGSTYRSLFACFQAFAITCPYFCSMSHHRLFDLQLIIKDTVHSYLSRDLHSIYKVCSLFFCCTKSRKNV